METDVLIIGAGPTGLALALWLTRLGVRLRIIDKTSEPAPFSRALGVQARTLEFYQQLGIVDELLRGGIVAESVNLWRGGTRAVRLPFKRVGADLTPFPYVFALGQDAHERVLIAQLAKLGVLVERSSELLEFEERDGAVDTLIGKNGGTERCRCSYLAGCDGAHSSVRDRLHVEFLGGTYEHLFYVADVDARGQVVDDGVHVELGAADLLAVFDMKGAGHVRLVGTVRTASGTGADRELSLADVDRRPIEQLGMQVDRVNWFSTYRVHHRVAQRFRVGRAFLLGDAAHVHSPVGAQGMNTGIGDAVNLAWKLADVIQRRADSRLLDTYESERIRFAKRLVATTDRVFELATHRSRVAAFLRTRAIPRLIALLFPIAALRRWLFRTVSQIAIEYHESPLSEGRAGTIRGGDRLPWVPASPGEASNFGPLASLRWQVHVYGEAPTDLRRKCEETGLETHTFDWRDEMRRAGFSRGAIYLVRPDGYVAFAAAAKHATGLMRYVRELRPPVSGAKEH